MVFSSGYANVLRLKPYGCSHFIFVVSTTSFDGKPPASAGSRCNSMSLYVIASTASQSSALYSRSDDFWQGSLEAAHLCRHPMVCAPVVSESDQRNPRYPAISFSPLENVGK